MGTRDEVKTVPELGMELLSKDFTSLLGRLDFKGEGSQKEFMRAAFYAGVSAGLRISDQMLAAGRKDSEDLSV